MKNISLIITSFLFFIKITTAQDSTLMISEFGKVDIAELQMKDCSFSPGASAVNLIKYKEVELVDFGSRYTEVITLTRYRIKIFNKNGYKNATIIIPYNSDNTLKIKNIQAATYNINENGQVKVTTVTEEEIYKNEGKKKDRYKSIKFTFPNVKEGSVLEYQVVQKYKMVYSVPSWYFQDDIPNLLCVYKVSRPHFSKLQKRVVADLHIQEDEIVDDSKSYERRLLRTTYSMRNIPAFKREAFMSSSLDYKYRMDFLVGSQGFNFPFNIWYSVNLLLLRSPAFGEQFDLKIPGTKSFIDSVKKLDSVPAKIHAVYHYVKQKVKWIGFYNLFCRELDKVWEEEGGTSAEINLSILNLLRKCDVQCFPVLYSTRWNGKVDYDFPDLSQFNTVNIAVINGKKFNLLDGTNPYLSYETPPFNVLNRTGMLIDPDNQTQINIDFDRKLLWDSIFVSASIDSNGILKGHIVKKYFDLAKSMKLQSAEEEEENEDKNISQIEPQIKADSSWLLNKEDEFLPLIEHSTFHYELPATNDFYFLNPFLFSDLSKNPFIDSTRKTDIDFGASTTSIVTVEIALPKQIKAQELPKNKQIQSPDSSVIFRYSNEIKNDTIYINSSIEINKAIFDKQDYPFLKKIFENIYGLLNNQLLLRKKEEQ